MQQRYPNHIPTNNPQSRKVNFNQFQNDYSRSINSSQRQNQIGGNAPGRHPYPQSHIQPHRQTPNVSFRSQSRFQSRPQPYPRRNSTQFDGINEAHGSRASKSQSKLYMANPRDYYGPSNERPEVRQVVYEEQPMRIPESIRNVEYVPHLNRFVEYVEQKVVVPVQKYFTDYYEIEHITDFVPRQYEDRVVEMVPEEIVRYRLQYVPVEQRIVHLNKENLYDANGLYRDVGSTIMNRGANRQDIYQDQVLAQGVLTGAQRNRGASGRLPNGLEESLVGALTNEVNANSRINYSNQGTQQSIGNAIRSNINELVPGTGSGQINQRQVSPAINKAIPKYNGNRNAHGLYRKRTNFVTSDNYFPNFEEEMRQYNNIHNNYQSGEYFSATHSADTANRFEGNKAAYGLANALGSAQGQNMGGNNNMDLNSLFKVPDQQQNMSGSNAAGNQAAYGLANALGSAQGQNMGGNNNMDLNNLFNVPGQQQNMHGSNASDHQAAYGLADNIFRESQASNGNYY